MTQNRALEQFERFLETGDPEVLSVSGRWGVGKTFAWEAALRTKRATTPLRRYAYVSLFGLRSVDAVRTAIVQSTVPLDGGELEPTVDSYVDHLSTFSGLGRMGERAARKGLGILTRGASTIPYVGKLADLLAPGAALLIRDQIICIDDIERAGTGLEVADVLGLVSNLRERRRCKVVLLLNEDDLGAQAERYRTYLEKVVDQAVKFEPTPGESAEAAIDGQDGLGRRLAVKTTALGIRNIRVIRRIRRFLKQIEPDVAGLHDGVTEQVLHSIALLGWCVFEPTLAPPLEHVQRYTEFSGMLGDESRSAEELRADQLLETYGFGSFDDLDALVLAGLQAGAFDHAAVRRAAGKTDQAHANGDVQRAVRKPWAILRRGLGDDLDEFVDAVATAIVQHGDAMTPVDASTAFHFLRELGRPDEVERLLPIYIQTQDGKSREFFAASARDHDRLEPSIAAAFDAKLSAMPLVRDPAEILLRIASTRSWNPEDVAFLATVPDDGYDRVLKELSGDDLQAAIAMALDFGRMQPARPEETELARRMASALRRASAEGTLNRLRLRPHLAVVAPGLEEPAETGPAEV